MSCKFFPRCQELRDAEEEVRELKVELSAARTSFAIIETGEALYPEGLKEVASIAIKRIDRGVTT